MNRYASSHSGSWSCAFRKPLIESPVTCLLQWASLRCDGCFAVDHGFPWADMLSLWSGIIDDVVCKTGAGQVTSLKLAGRLTSAINHLASSVRRLSLLFFSCSCHAWPFNIVYTASQKWIPACDNSLVGEGRSVRILSCSIPSNAWSALIYICALSVSSIAQSVSVFLILLGVYQPIDLLPSIWIALPFELLRGERRFGLSTRWERRSRTRVHTFTFTITTWPKATPAISYVFTLLRKLAGYSQDKRRYSHYCNNEAYLLWCSWVSNKNRIVSKSNAGDLLLSVDVWVLSW